MSRVPPHDLDAEESVLGSVLLAEEALLRVSTTLTEHDFYRGVNRHVYRAALNLMEKGEPIDIVTVGAELETMGVLESVGGRAHLASLESGVPTAENAEYYAAIVLDKAQKRELLEVARSGSESAFNDTEEAGAIIDTFQQSAFRLGLRGASGEFRKLPVNETLDSLDRVMQSGGGLIGISSGLKGIDDVTLGFRPGELTYVAGRAGMGKTAFCMNVALNVAKAGTPVAVFSLEMGAERLTERLLCSEARVDAYSYKKGLLAEAAMDKIVTAAGKLNELPLWIDDSADGSIAGMTAKARRAKHKAAIGLFVVDYVQLMHGRRDRGDSREQEVASCSKALRAIARNVGVPVLAACQLNRAPDARKDDKRPTLADMRESGQIENDADVVIGMFRPWYYSKDEDPNAAEAIFLKHRNGPLKTVRLGFAMDQVRFYDMARV